MCTRLCLHVCIIVETTNNHIMSRIVRIVGELPPTLNDQIRIARSGWQQSNREKQKWTQYVANKASQFKPFHEDSLIWVQYHWFVKNLARDSDNIAASAKYINDGIVSAGLIRNDNLKVIQSPVTHYYHKSSSDYFVVLVADDIALLSEALHSHLLHPEDNLC